MSNPIYDSDNISIYEWPQPCFELLNKETGMHTVIRDNKDAEAIIKSLTSLIKRNLLNTIKELR